MAQMGRAAREKKGWWRSHKWLLLRRTSQLLVLGLFLLGPWFGVWLIKGNLSSSLLLETVPMTDPHLFVQSLASGHLTPYGTMLTGVLIVLLFYWLVGGRSFCAWVCPLNPVTDLAGWLRRALNMKGGANLPRTTRYWVLAATLGLAAVSGGMAWETINPVSITHRGLIFGMGAGWLVVAGIFLFDLLVAKDGWCGHVCPTGALYGLIGKASFVRVRAARRSACNDCMDCFAVCPEPQVITPALRGAGKGIGPVIDLGVCTNCGRCIDVCAENVFEMNTRFPNRVEEER